MNTEKSPVIGYLSAANYYDRNSWSGILYHMHKALKESGQNVIDLGGPREIGAFERIRKSVERLLSNSPTDPRPGTRQFSGKYETFTKVVAKQLKRSRCDVLFAPGSSAELTFLETNIPIIYLSDVTFKLFRELYSHDLTNREADVLEHYEQIAIQKATSLIYPSTWAARSAVEDYHASPGSIHIVPFGANLKETPESKALAAKNPSAICRLLWIGRDWHRKNGQIAVDTLLALRKSGVRANLTIIGCIPPEGIPREGITVITNIDKNRTDQERLLQSILYDSHFFVFPTRADCSPIVLCEAAAYGLPVLASDVGGISTIIEEGKNGHLLPLGANGEDYARVISDDLSNPGKYNDLVISSRKAYEVRLNWWAWAESFRAVVETSLETKQ